MDEFSSSLVILCCFGFFICFHFLDKWSLSDRQGFSLLNYPLLQSTPQVSFVFIVLCYFFNSLFGGLSNQLRCNSLSDDFFKSTPLVLFIIVAYLYRRFGLRSE